MEHPDKRLKNPCLQFRLTRKNWYISPPYAQWADWHIIKNDGGILPLNVDAVIDLYRRDPLSQDSLAKKYSERFQQYEQSKQQLMISHYFTIIESIEFITLLGVSSSFTMFERILYQQPSVKSVLELTEEFDWARQKVKNRIVDLATRVIDETFENPWDTALTAYLPILMQSDIDLAKQVSQSVTKSKNLWWSIKVARKILSDGCNWEL